MKNKRNDTPVPDAGTYRMAAVASLTGIPAATIRIWERRYVVVQPARSSGNVRLYAQTDIDRLVMVKAAVDAGHPISMVAALNLEQLKRRVEKASRPDAHRVVRVAVCGETLAAVLAKGWKGRRDLQLTVRLTEEAVVGPTPATPADVTIMDVPVLQQLSIENLRCLRKSTHAAVTLVIYGLGGQEKLAALARDGFIALPGPVSAAHLAQICLLHFAKGVRVAPATQRLRAPASRRYDDAQLASINQTLNAVACECPNHLSDLLIRINAFEQYSVHCEGHSAEDASLHGMMASVSARCRKLLEEALARALAHTVPGSQKRIKSGKKS